MEKDSRFKLFKDILKEKGKYSQGRVYLLWSVIAYYLTLGVLMFSGIRKDDIEMENFKIIVDGLQYAMTLFGGYVFGGKFISMYQAIKGTKSKSEDEE